MTINKILIISDDGKSEIEKIIPKHLMPKFWGGEKNINLSNNLGPWLE